ncbi:hypothetical protein LP419_06645 [Massilia sp. H-1]|nr:hypothetical protein LP419_06645 [Massilia sp. H-1]
MRTLLLTGQDRFYDRLHALGFDSLDQLSRFLRTVAGAGIGRSVAAGAGQCLPHARQRRLARQRHAHARAPETGQRVLDAGASFIIGDMLSDRAARSVTFGLKNELATTFWSAVKTGTSKDMRDNWCVGYTDRYTVAVWVGNFDGKPMWDVSGVTGAAPVWRDVVDYLHRKQPSRAPELPRLWCASSWPSNRRWKRRAPSGSCAARRRR